MLPSASRMVFVQRSSTPARRLRFIISAFRNQDGAGLGYYEVFPQCHAATWWQLELRDVRKCGLGLTKSSLGLVELVSGPRGFTADGSAMAQPADAVHPFSITPQGPGTPHGNLFGVGVVITTQLAAGK